MRARFAGVFLVLALTASCLAGPETRPSHRVPEGVTVLKDVAYVPNGDPSQVLDLFVPRSDKPVPVIIFIHGGGWRGGSKTGNPAIWYLADGYAAASIEYRFSQKAVFPAQMQDCQAALRFLRANATKYNIDPDHFAVWGASAGGHLVALVGTSGGKKAFPAVGGNEDQSDRVQAVCDWFGPTDFTTVVAQAADDKLAKNVFRFNTPADPYSGLIGANLDDTAKSTAVSPIHYVSKDNPPFLIMHGDHDQMVPYAQSVELVDALKKVGVDVTLQTFPGAVHGGPAFSAPASRKLIKAFFDKTLKGQDVKVEPIPADEAAAMTTPKKDAK